MKPLTLNQAAKQARKSKAAVLEALNNGTLSGSKNGLNQWQIDPAELFRVYPENWLEEPKTEPQKPPKTAETLAELLETEKKEREREREERRHEIEQQQATIEDLRRRLDKAETEREAANIESRRLVLMITHQPEKKPDPAPVPDQAKPEQDKVSYLSWFARLTRKPTT